MAQRARACFTAAIHNDAARIRSSTGGLEREPFPYDIVDFSKLRQDNIARKRAIARSEVGVTFRESPPPAVTASPAVLASASSSGGSLNFLTSIVEYQSTIIS